MSRQRFVCLPDHPENYRWLSEKTGKAMGCNATWKAKPGGTKCPQCGAEFVQRVSITP